MSITLYDIATEMRDALEAMEEWAADHDGDVTGFPLEAHLGDLRETRDRKLLSLACLHKEKIAEAEAIESEIKRLSERAQVAKNAAKRMKALIAAHLPAGEKLRDARVELAWRKSEGTIVEGEPEALPAEYVKYKIEADVTGIKAALKAGKEIPGCRLETRQNLQVK